MSGFGIVGWMQDWADNYDQEWNDSRLSDFVGKTIEGVGEDANATPHTFKGKVVGYSIDKIYGEEDVIVRTSFILEQGLQVHIFTNMTITEVEAE